PQRNLSTRYAPRNVIATDNTLGRPRRKHLGDPVSSLGPAAVPLSCHSRLHLIHRLLQFSFHPLHFYLHLLHHLIELSLARETVVIREHPRRLFDPPFDLVDLATYHCRSPSVHRVGRSCGRLVWCCVTV